MTMTSRKLSAAALTSISTSSGPNTPSSQVFISRPAICPGLSRASRYTASSPVATREYRSRTLTILDAHRRRSRTASSRSRRSHRASRASASRSPASPRSTSRKSILASSPTSMAMLRTAPQSPLPRGFSTSWAARRVTTVKRHSWRACSILWETSARTKAMNLDATRSPVGSMGSVPTEEVDGPQLGGPGPFVERMERGGFEVFFGDRVYRLGRIEQRHPVRRPALRLTQHPPGARKLAGLGHVRARRRRLQQGRRPSRANRCPTLARLDCAALVVTDQQQASRHCQPARQFPLLQPERVVVSMQEDDLRGVGTQQSGLQRMVRGRADACETQGGIAQMERVVEGAGGLLPVSHEPVLGLPVPAARGSRCTLRGSCGPAPGCLPTRRRDRRSARRPVSAARAPRSAWRARSPRPAIGRSAVGRPERTSVASESGACCRAGRSSAGWR